ncbi:Tafazzin [Trema orientale]|uniref:Tafazzin family protein n=1 Tax=Trema orientale TaxID=63057 RepID=A0A2P5FRA3_TREOI|nr:Tafazzin [Trema orientale]
MEESLLESKREDEGRKSGRKMEWAGRENHLGGIPRRIALMAVGGLAKLITSSRNSTSVHNAETLLRLVRSRPPGVPLITVANHMSNLDDPLMWGFHGFPITDPKLARWLHIFPEGKICQEDAPLRRLKWGTASLIIRATVTPIVLPIAHHGFEQVMSQTPPYGRRPLLPFCNKKISIIVGEPIELDLPKMRKMAISLSHNVSLPSLGWPNTPDGLNEEAQKHLYSAISEKIRTAMESLRTFGNDEKV